MLEILTLISKWRKQILFFTLFAIIASIVITMPAIMPAYYKSRMIFYLSNPVSTDRAALFNEKEVGGVSIFGGKEDINRFLSILNSDPVSLSIIKKYHLGQHYNIKADNAQMFDYYTLREFSNNFNAIRDDLGAIEVTMLDQDPKLAALIAKDIVLESDSVYRSMLTETKSTVLSLLNKQIAEKTLKLSGDAGNADELRKLMSVRDQYAVSASNDFKTLYIVESPVPAVKKSKPVRWLIVLSTAAAAFVFSSLTALVLELYKNADKYGFQRS